MKISVTCTFILMFVCIVFKKSAIINVDWKYYARYC
jgi:hypothetical protein